jgi:hypothetical protein
LRNCLQRNNTQKKCTPNQGFWQAACLNLDQLTVQSGLAAQNARPGPWPRLNKHLLKLDRRRRECAGPAQSLTRILHARAMQDGFRTAVTGILVMIGEEP